MVQTLSVYFVFTSRRSLQCFVQRSMPTATVVLAWRNHPEVRAVSLTQHEIGAEEHARWWSAVQQDPERRGLHLRPPRRAGGCGHLLRHRPCGRQRLVGLLPRQRRPERARRADAGLDRHPAQGDPLCVRGAAVRTLEGEVLAANEAVRRLNRRHGFTEVGTTTRDVDGTPTEVIRVRLQRARGDGGVNRSATVAEGRLLRQGCADPREDNQGGDPSEPRNTTHGPHRWSRGRTGSRPVRHRRDVGQPRR